MPSGHFHSIPIDSISVNREGRQRRELTDIGELASSLALHGLINPILIQRDTHELIAGERRLTAARSLGWTAIAAQYEDEVDPSILRLLELEENIRRVDLPWVDQCKAIAEYHRLKKEENPEWSQEMTADALGTSRPDVVQKLAVAAEILKGNAVIAEAPKYSTALGLVRRSSEREKSATLESLRYGGVTKLHDHTAPASTILHADFLEWAPVYTGPRFNFIHCDFPYGIDANKRSSDGVQGYTQKSLGSYDDSEDVYWALCECLARNLDRLAQDSCHLMFWFSMRFYRETLDFFSKHTDFKVDAFPLIWHKSDNVGLLPDPERGPRRIYETALFASRGDRKVVRAVSNSVLAATERDTHMSAKPAPMLESFFRMFVDGFTEVLDPTAGSGSALRAAKRLGASRVLGLERDADFAERANKRFEEENS